MTAPDRAVTLPEMHDLGGVLVAAGHHRQLRALDRACCLRLELAAPLPDVVTAAQAFGDLAFRRDAAPRFADLWSESQDGAEEEQLGRDLQARAHLGRAMRPDGLTLVSSLHAIGEDVIR